MPSTQKKKPGQLFEFFSPFQQTHNLGNSYFRTANSLLIEPSWPYIPILLGCHEIYSPIRLVLYSNSLCSPPIQTTIPNFAKAIQRYQQHNAKETTIAAELPRKFQPQSKPKSPKQPDHNLLCVRQRLA